jgi:hypothetical protein
MTYGTATTFNEFRQRNRELLDELNRIHEAGHAVVAVRLGVEVFEVFSPFPSSTEYDLGGCARSSNVSDEDDLLIRFAGAGAEVIFRKVSWTMAFRSAAGGDWKASQEVIDELALLEPRKQVVKKAKARVIALLTEQWENVLAVAAALRDRRRLSGGELQQIVASAGKAEP